MRSKRREAQPSGIKTFGSTFKNPDDERAGGRSSGQLLDAAGCRGLRVGGASFSAKHANFVDNDGTATTADILALMAEGRRRVHELTGVVLEPEVQVLGEVEWPDGLGPRRRGERRLMARASGTSDIAPAGDLDAVVAAAPQPPDRRRDRPRRAGGRLHASGSGTRRWSQIETVKVTGANVAPGVEEELSSAATGLSTLHLDRGAIEAAVADDPSVVALKIETDFPHGVTIDVESRTPAGWLDADGGTLIAADGTVLGTGVDRPEGIPEIAGSSDAVGERATGAELASARVLGAVPAPLQEQVTKATVDDQHGVVVELNGGIELRFGSPGAADQKWRAAAAVLADPKLTSAIYIDLSVPSRPVVG